MGQKKTPVTLIGAPFWAYSHDIGASKRFGLAVTNYGFRGICRKNKNI